MIQTKQGAAGDGAPLLNFEQQQHSDSTPEIASSTGATQDLIGKIKAHIAAGDKATKKAGDHYIAAGQYLKTLKEGHGGSWAEWEALLKDKIGIGKSRASELMQIAEGRKTIGDIRDGYAKANAKRNLPTRSLHVHGETDDDAADEMGDGDNVAPPEVIRKNALDILEGHYAVARAYKKVFKVASLDQAAKKEVSAAIDRLIAMWRSSQRVLLSAADETAPVEPPPAEPTEPTAAARAVASDDDLDIPEFLRRDRVKP